MMSEEGMEIEQRTATGASPNGVSSGRQHAACLVERAVLGAAIAQPAAAVELSRLVPDDFVDPLHQTIFTALRAIYDEGQQIDPTAIALRLEACDELGANGGPAYLGLLAASCPAVSHVRLYVAQLIELSGERKLAAVIDDLVQVRNSASNWREKCAAAMTVGVRLYGETLLRQGERSGSSSVGDLCRDANPSSLSDGARPERVLTGAADLDSALGLLCPGVVVYLVGQCDELLSKFGLYLAESFSVRDADPVTTLFISQILPPAYLAAVTLARKAALPLARVVAAAALEPTDLAALQAARQSLRVSPLYIVSLMDNSLAGFKRLFLNHCAVHGCPRVVFLDQCDPLIERDPGFVAEMAAWSRDFGVVVVCMMTADKESEAISPLAVIRRGRLFEAGVVCYLHNADEQAFCLSVSRSPFIATHSLAFERDTASERVQLRTRPTAVVVGGVHD